MSLNNPIHGSIAQPKEIPLYLLSHKNLTEYAVLIELFDELFAKTTRLAFEPGHVYPCFVLDHWIPGVAQGCIFIAAVGD